MYELFITQLGKQVRYTKQTESAVIHYTVFFHDPELMSITGNSFNFSISSDIQNFNIADLKISVREPTVQHTGEKERMEIAGVILMTERDIIVDNCNNTAS